MKIIYIVIIYNKYRNIIRVIKNITTYTNKILYNYTHDYEIPTTFVTKVTYTKLTYM